MSLLTRIQRCIHQLLPAFCYDGLLHHHGHENSNNQGQQRHHPHISRRFTTMTYQLLFLLVLSAFLLFVSMKNLIPTATTSTLSFSSSSAKTIAVSEEETKYDDDDDDNNDSITNNEIVITTAAVTFNATSPTTAIYTPWIRPNKIFGHIHIAKTAGTELNGILAAKYERICGHKGYSYDYYQYNERLKADPSHNVVQEGAGGYDTLSHIPPKKIVPKTKTTTKAGVTKGSTKSKNGQKRLQRKLALFGGGTKKKTPLSKKQQPQSVQSQIAMTTATKSKQQPSNLQSKANPQFNRGRVHVEIMKEIGYENCDYISQELGWKFWDQFPKSWPFEFHVPCRDDPIDHLMSMCNHKQKDWNCNTANTMNDTLLEKEVNKCVLEMNRFSIGLRNIGELKCFSVTPNIQSYLQYMNTVLQPKRFPIDNPVHRESNVRKRDKADECIWESQYTQLRQRMTTMLQNTYEYYQFCHDCIGSTNDLLLAENTTANTITKGDETIPSPSTTSPPDGGKASNNTNTYTSSNNDKANTDGNTVNQNDDGYIGTDDRDEENELYFDDDEIYIFDYQVDDEKKIPDNAVDDDVSEDYYEAHPTGGLVKEEVEKTKINNNSDTTKNTTKPIIMIVACTKSFWKWKINQPIQTSIVGTHFLPSLLWSITNEEYKKYNVQLLLAFDTGDKFWETLSVRTTYQTKFGIPSTNNTATSSLRNQRQFTTTTTRYVPINFVSIRKDYRKKKSRIPFNEACQASYEYGAEYLVRVNDDTQFLTRGWITQGIQTLKNYQPSNIGVVGPYDINNPKILTHDMTHRTHLDIFNHYYYPQQFDNWYLDNWITNVYNKNHTTMTKLWKVQNQNKVSGGTRYNVNATLKQELPNEIKRGRQLIEEYIMRLQGNYKKMLENDDGNNDDLFCVLGTNRTSLLDGPIAKFVQKYLDEKDLPTTTGRCLSRSKH